MWQDLARIILRNRLFIIIGLFLITVFMGYQATKVELLYEFGQLLPEKDSINQDYLKFRKDFGQDGLVIVIGTEVDDFYSVEKFTKWRELGNRIKQLELNIIGSNPPAKGRAVDSVFSEAHLYNLVKNNELKKFEIKPISNKEVLTQSDVDSIRDVVQSLPFYDGMLYKSNTDIHLMMIFVNEKLFNSKSRKNLIPDILKISDEYTDYFGDLKFSGLPFIRSVTMAKVQGELGLFVALALLVTAMILFVFYRSFKVVLVSLIVVSIGVIWCLGFTALFGYKITLLMGLMPPLMIVIGIPNCVYLITKYQQEYITHGNKAKALSRVVKKVGNATFLTNATTAMGFATFLLTHSSMMQEFGMIASISIISLFVISILVITILYSYLKPPKEKHTNHLNKKWIDGAINTLLYITEKKRTLVYISSVLIIIIGGFGISKMYTSGNIVDDLPKNDDVVKDLKYFESKLNGVMPFEIIVTAKDTIYKSYRNIKTIDQIQEAIKGEDKLSKSISLVDGIKYISQAYSNGSPDKFILRDEAGLYNIMQSAHFKNTFDLSQKEKSSDFLGNFMDSTHTQTRITVQIADIGIDSMEAVLERVKEKIDHILLSDQKLIDQIISAKGDQRHQLLDELYAQSPWILSSIEDSLMRFDPTLDEFSFMDEDIMKSFQDEPYFDNLLKQIGATSSLTYIVTGTGVVYTKGTTYLVNNLFISLFTAICMIALLMSFLFRSWRMVLVSLIPNILPLIFTSGLMGYMGIPIKPSTILVFSIAFGISVDDTIHFLAKYRQELKYQSWNLKTSIQNAIKEVGISMIYTSIILFFGFSIFTASSFGGTQALGLLVSVTLFVAMLSNLILLPSLLLTLDKIVTNKVFKDPLLEVIDEEEDIELEELAIEKKRTETV
jgi:predicted RND superfamily exporter protein